MIFDVYHKTVDEMLFKMSWLAINWKQLVMETTISSALTIIVEQPMNAN